MKILFSLLVLSVFLIKDCLVEQAWRWSFLRSNCRFRTWKDALQMRQSMLSILRSLVPQRVVSLKRSSAVVYSVPFKYNRRFWIGTSWVKNISSHAQVPPCPSPPGEGRVGARLTVKSSLRFCPCVLCGQHLGPHLGHTESCNFCFLASFVALKLLSALLTSIPASFFFAFFYSTTTRESEPGYDVGALRRLVQYHASTLKSQNI